MSANVAVGQWVALSCAFMTQDKQHDKSRLWTLTLGALGVVFGDIGTSPLYSLRECFSTHYNLPVTADNVLGILSLIIWSLFVVVSVKYMLFVMRADNKGEGGILALLALAVPPDRRGGRRKWVVLVGLFGAALLYGDGVITPAITVLSAMEGLSIATPFFDQYIVLFTVVILTGVFYLQSAGTHRIGVVFGPIILLYFALLTALGLPYVIHSPFIFHAFNPLHAVHLFMNHGTMAFFALGSVFLAVTGCEALYADMGHFGRLPIRLGWSYVVLPALLINYLGQGALLIEHPEAVTNPFFLMAPEWALYPTVALATMASIIASQALISGVFSLTSQAISLGFCPRLEIVHTSSREIGQIFIPSINWMLMLSTIWLVLEFRTSSHLAGAYGIAVALTMLITTYLAVMVARHRWRWRTWTAALVAVVFLIIDSVFLGANVPKIPHGGWFPLLTALGVFTLMTTWKRGRRILAIRLRAHSERFSDFIARPLPADVVRVPGTALFMTSDPDMIPPALARNLKHNHVMHECVLMLSLITRDVPRVNKIDRARVEKCREGLYRVTCSFGFMETASITEVLDAIALKGLDIPPKSITFFLGRETLIATRRNGGMAMWREHMFSVMSRNAYRATQFFHIPPEQVIEIGSQIEL